MSSEPVEGEARDPLAHEIQELKLKVGEISDRLDVLSRATMDMKADISKLSSGLESLQREVYKLSESFGHIVEDIARSVLPSILFTKMGVSVESLERRFFELDGKTVEVDIYGLGKRLAEGEAVVVVGEAKARIHGEDVRLFHEKAQRILGHNGCVGDPVLVMYGLYLHPTAIEEAKKRGVSLISPYLELVKLKAPNGGLTGHSQQG
ncbi:hypothetical protein TCELL_1291 [Thermogladius calderae 1633]|uniref:DUF8196 domain-containing protein n=1 Tax=Thermogladius calderae (strain DSM 22663 / VKM B-2946 / 1633) TaxID=1184251 RepID=I3TG26_THEC1|nr:hypothetical protein [Thermogladius calderae]AFK51714.1 hypothetical protein TCELL_1291 [Thermogladius calderae 1633]